MAKDDDRLIIEVELDDGKLAKGFVSADKVAKRAGRKAGNDFGRSAVRSSRDSLVSLRNVVLGIGAAFAGAFATREIIEKAKVQENAVNSLNASLRNMGAYTPELSRELQNYASELQSVTTFGDEAIISQMAFAQAMGASAEQSKEILAAATDMSAALDIDLNSAVRNISKTLGGYAGELGEVIPELKNLTQEQLRAGAGVELLAKRFDGFARSEVNTFDGASKQLSNTFGDLLEEVGKIITESPQMIGIFKQLSKTLKGAAGVVGDFRKNLNIFQDIIEPILAFNDAMITYVVSPFELLLNVATVVQGQINKFFAAAVASAGMFGGAIADLLAKFGVDGDMVQGLRDFRDSSNEVFQEVARDATQSVNEILDFPISEAMAGKNEELRMALSGLGEVASSELKKIPKAAADAGDDTTQSLKDMAKQAGTLMKNGLGRAVAGGIQNVTQSLIDGQDAFKNFGQFIAGVFGDLAIQLGTFFITQGIAALAMKSLDFSGTIAGGAALVALGTLLKSWSGGAADTAASGSVGAQTGGQSYGTQEGESSAFEEDEPEIERQAGQQITVNIQGNVLDGDESGLRIVEMLNKTIREQGAVLA